MQAATRTELGRSKPPHLDVLVQVYTGITTSIHPLVPAAGGLRRAMTLSSTLRFVKILSWTVSFRCIRDAMIKFKPTA
jgi:hypothetical protein